MAALQARFLGETPALWLRVRTGSRPGAFITSRRFAFQEILRAHAARSGCGNVSMGGVNCGGDKEDGQDGVTEDYVSGEPAQIALPPGSRILRVAEEDFSNS